MILGKTRTIPTCSPANETRRIKAWTPCLLDIMKIIIMKIQNLAAGPSIDDLTINDQPVSAMTNFFYLGSIITSDFNSHDELHRCIGIASSTMYLMNHVWNYSTLSIQIKIHIYPCCTLLVLPHCSAEVLNLFVPAVYPTIVLEYDAYPPPPIHL